MTKEFYTKGFLDIYSFLLIRKSDLHVIESQHSSVHSFCIEGLLQNLPSFEKAKLKSLLLSPHNNSDTPILFTDLGLKACVQWKDTENFLLRVSKLSGLEYGANNNEALWRMIDKDLFILDHQALDLLALAPAETYDFNTFFKTLTPDSCQKLKSAIALLYDFKTPFKIHVSTTHKGNYKKYYFISGRVDDELGPIGEIQDCTELTLQQNLMEMNTQKMSELACQTQQLQSALSSTTGILKTDEKGKISHINSMGCKILNSSRMSILGKRLEEALNDSSFKADLHKAIKENSELTFSFLKENTQGHQVHIRGKVIPFLSTSKNLRPLIILDEVTEGKRLHAQMHEMQELLEKTQESASIGGWKIDFKNQRIFVSKKMFSLLGIKKDEDLTIESFLAHLPQDGLRKRIPNQNSAEIEEEFYDKKTSKSFLLTAGHSFRGIKTGTLQDITSIVKRRDEIRKKNKKLHDSLRLQEAISLTLSCSSTLTPLEDQVNDILVVILSLNLKSFLECILFTPHEKLTPILNGPCLIGEDESWKKSDHALRKTYTLADEQREYGTLTLFQHKVSISSEDSTTMDKILPVFTEVLAKSYLAFEKNEQEVKAIHASKMAGLGEMSSGMAHEIKNPLAVIDATVYKLRLLNKKEKLTNDILLDSLGKLQSMSGRIVKIVSGLQKFAREGSMDPIETVSIKEVFDEVLDLCQQRMVGHNIRFEIGNTSDQCIYARQIELSQVLVNLINNAFDALLENVQDDKWISLEVSPSINNDDFLELAVTDSGSGISEENAKKIFNPFFTTKEIGKGTGLGLSISKGLIEKMDGEFYLDHQSPTTRFVIRIPKSQEEPKKAA